MKVKKSPSRGISARQVKKDKPNLRISASGNARVAKHTILTVIILAMLTVLAYTIFTIIATPEFLVKRKIESLTSDYYENYFYPKILENNSLKKDDVLDPASAESHLSSIMEKYLDTGFSRITLNQLFLYDNRKNYAAASSISKYCDLNKTTIKIFPESPYTVKSYRVDYKYSCNF
ncbi:hypothetical protein IJG95_00955 [Candidatus Saccharibacteria bacterium]|nr:hypothetical protein [Candidatus Saccharibacteria bacterium]